MDTLLSVFQQLGANKTLLYQFAIVVVMFYLARFLFLDRLQTVLDGREDKTVNLEGSAEKKFDEIEKIQQDYKQQVQKAVKELKEKSASAKAEVVKKEETKYRAQEKEVNSYVEGVREKIEVELNEKKVVVLKEAEKLADNLVEKIAKGV